MKINLKATNIELSEAISQYVDKKLIMLEKYFEQSKGDEVLALIEVGKSTRHHKSGDVFMAEIHIKANGKEFYAVSEKDDLYAAIDEVKDEITRSITSRRKKAIALLRRGGTRIKEMLKNLPFRRRR